MIKSMTGFGRGEIENDILKVGIEMKSVNHRYCEIVLRMPRSLNVLEDRIKRVIQQKVARGRVDVYINMELCGPGRVTVKVDETLAASYLQTCRELQARLGVSGEITISELMHLSGVFSLEEAGEDAQQWWPALEAALQAALDGLMAMRVREGRQLAADISERAARITAHVKEIEQRSPVVVEEYRDRLRQRLKELLDSGAMDPARLDTEVVIFAERSNIAEEVTRLKSHLEQLAGCLGIEAPVGRKLDFLLQEMNREINTIASKSSDLAISRTVVEVKSELEKIREQVQNIE
ncbi:YicC/YloC family endoribonuclease [Desulfoscipio geothermicus]|uniref:TIGR00255 family protein n=1 Tax=Desulfoscipio geothermicus DSM 3669 TaxID=1121426 RepID=A0A1I6DJH3_9FIRM|nr:YicC/YloC family endoribonuclease [Desulfoscipio geothermicus]SFR05579.1 TIGR00255 family protein [Desulfoscipio geothermicus DSM 3669]